MCGQIVSAATIPILVADTSFRGKLSMGLPYSISILVYRSFSLTPPPSLPTPIFSLPPTITDGDGVTFYTNRVIPNKGHNTSIVPL